MKKIVFLVLVLAICLSLCACGKSDTCPYDCEQCAEYEKQAQATETEDATSDVETVEQDDNVIKFETPIVVAEDENIRVELVKFYQDYRTFDVHGYPSNANAATEGATLEKYVVFNYCNKTDHALRIELKEIYLGSDSAFSVYARISDNVAAGKKVLREHIIQTGEKETVKSMEELYSLDGDFYVWHVGDDDVSRDRYRLKFSIPNGMNASSEAPAADNTEAWNQFREYLKANGPVTVIENSDDSQKLQYQNKTTIEEKDGTIQVSRVGEGSMVSGIVRYHALETIQFELPSNAKAVTVLDDFLEEGTDENGTPRKKVGSANYTWDIQNYHRGDEISYEMPYSELEQNGNTVQKNGVVTATDVYADVANALNQTLAKSGLVITMADLGFANY